MKDQIKNPHYHMGAVQPGDRGFTVAAAALLGFGIVIGAAAAGSWYELHPSKTNHMVYDPARDLWDRQRGSAAAGTVAAGIGPNGEYTTIRVNDKGWVFCAPVQP